MTATARGFATRGAPDLVAAALAALEREGPVASLGSGSRTVELEGRAAYLKYGALTGKHRLRHALRSLRPGVHVPRIQEFENLTWLRAHDFRAPLPLAAGVRTERGLPVFQFLATELVPDTRTLRAVLESGASTGDERGVLFTRLGEDVARMHGLGFVHRDLYPRNLLVARTGADAGLYFLDAWRAAPGLGLRGAPYDLACLLLYAPELMSAEDQRALLASYFAARDHRGERLNRARVLAAVRRNRSRLVRRLVQKGRTRPPIPRATWEPPELD